jgi:hypothetical protein
MALLFGGLMCVCLLWILLWLLALCGCLLGMTELMLLLDACCAWLLDVAACLLACWLLVTACLLVAGSWMTDVTG